MMVTGLVDILTKVPMAVTIPDISKIFLNFLKFELFYKQSFHAVQGAPHGSILGPLEFPVGACCTLKVPWFDWCGSFEGVYIQSDLNLH